MAKISRTRVEDTPAEETDHLENVRQIQEQELEEERELHAKRRTTSSVASGWGAPAEERREVTKVGGYLDFKDSNSHVVKILDAEPVARWKRHFLGQGQRPMYCIQEDCPVCAKGWKSTWVYRVNVVQMDIADNEEHKVVVWDFSYPVKEQLVGFVTKMALNDPRRYFQLLYIKGKGVTVVPMSRDMMEQEHDIFPLSDGELEALEEQRVDDSSVFTNTRSQLAERAASLPVYVAKKNGYDD